MEELTPKQARFVEEYLIDLNATQAAVRAGYSKKSAHGIGHQNLANPMIRKHIDQRMSALSESTQITAERVLQGIARIAFDDANDPSVRLKGLELLGRHVGLWHQTNTTREVVFVDLSGGQYRPSAGDVVDGEYEAA